MQNRSDPQSAQRPDPAGRDDRSQVDIAQAALALKRENERDAPHFEERTPGAGMNPAPHHEQAPSGAFDHAGHHPAMQRAKFDRR
jgi:hypothetical protein